jgi:hypothetical protein
MTDALIEAVARALAFHGVIGQPQDQRLIDIATLENIPAARAAIAAIEASGTHVVVPAEPTDEMCEEMHCFHGWPAEAYAAALRSRPKVNT